MSSANPKTSSAHQTGSSSKRALILVNDENLSALDLRPSIPQYISKLWKFRFFIKADASGKAFSAGRDTYLGKFWLILEPLLQVSVYFLVFGMILKTDRGIDNYLGFLVIGVIFFGFVSKGISSGSLLMQQSSRLVSSFRFPRASIVVARALRSFYDNLVPACTALVIAICLQDTIQLQWQYLLVIPLFVILHLFILGATFIVARATAFIPDLKSLVSLLTRALFFTSGVFFSIERFDANPTVAQFVEWNPIYEFLSMFRMLILYGQTPDLSHWVYVSMWSLTLLFVGFFYFWQAEERYATIR